MGICETNRATEPIPSRLLGTGVLEPVSISHSAEMSCHAVCKNSTTRQRGEPNQQLALIDQAVVDCVEGKFEAVGDAEFVEDVV